MSDRRLELAGLLAVTLFGTAVALTRNPEGAVVERAKGWPVVGPWAARLQATFRAPPPARPPELPPTEIVILRLRVPDPPAPRERAAPVAARPGAAPVDAGPVDRTPLPPMPLASLPADPELRAAAIRLLGEAARAAPLGPYELFADFEPPARWQLLAAALDGAFAERFGVVPRDRPRETVVAYRDREAYRALQRLEPRLEGLDPSGHAGRGLAAIAAEQPEAAAAEATLVHELAHFVERRAIGPGLPPWLAEGLAEDLAWTPFDAATGFRWGELREGVRRDGGRIVVSGAAAGLEELGRAVEAGRGPGLEAVAVLDDHAFAAGAEAPQRYAHALWWVRFLLDGGASERAAGLRRFVAGVAAGEPADLPGLERALGERVADLEPGFREFLLERRRTEVDLRLSALAGPGERIVLHGGRELATPAP